MQHEIIDDDSSSIRVVRLFSERWIRAFENAQAQAKGKPAAGEKTKSLSFEDELVEGATAKPELFYLFQKKNFNFKRLIKLRENFVPEMRRTSEDVQRGRGSN